MKSLSYTAQDEAPAPQTKRKGVRGPVAALGLSTPGLREFAAHKPQVCEEILMWQAGHHEIVAEILRKQTAAWRAALRQNNQVARNEVKKPRPVFAQGTIGMPQELRQAGGISKLSKEHKGDSARKLEQSLKKAQTWEEHSFLTTLLDQVAYWNERIRHRKQSAKNSPKPLQSI